MPMAEFFDGGFRWFLRRHNSGDRASDMNADVNTPPSGPTEYPTLNAPQRPRRLHRPSHSHHDQLHPHSKHPQPDPDSHYPRPHSHCHHDSRAAPIPLPSYSIPARRHGKPDATVPLHTPLDRVHRPPPRPIRRVLSKQLHHDRFSPAMDSRNTVHKHANLHICSPVPSFASFELNADETGPTSHDTPFRCRYRLSIDDDGKILMGKGHWVRDDEYNSVMKDGKWYYRHHWHERKILN